MVTIAPDFRAFLAILDATNNGFYPDMMRLTIRSKYIQNSLLNLLPRL